MRRYIIEHLADTFELFVIIISPCAAMAAAFGVMWLIFMLLRSVARSLP